MCCRAWQGALLTLGFRVSGATALQMEADGRDLLPQGVLSRTFAVNTSPSPTIAAAHDPANSHPPSVGLQSLSEVLATINNPTTSNILPSSRAP